MSRKKYFPFTAVAGQERLKLALILNAINPEIKGVLISGEKGTAKSTLVRGLSQLVCDMRVIEVPLNITEDRLVGTLKLTDALKDGKRNIEYGLLHDADGQLLYIDEVNLLSAHISNIIAETASRGENFVERDGVSFCHRCRFALVGTMNPEEGFLRPQLLDKFGMFVSVSGEKDNAVRSEIIRRYLEYEKNPISFYEKYAGEEALLHKRISNAKTCLSDIRITHDNFELAAFISHNAGCEGNRCEIILIEAAKALAAWNNKALITEGDIQLASELVLPHRMKKPTEQCTQNFEEASDADDSSTESSEEIEEFQAAQPDEDNACQPQEESPEEETESPEGSFDISLQSVENRRKKLSGSGKRNKVQASQASGRYVKSGFPDKKTTDIAIVPTLCAAAIFQGEREHSHGMKITVRRDDFREKRREKRTGATILFVVDASGSMGARRRMKAVKGAVLSLLSEAYQKRDRVGAIAFKGQKAEILLNITGSLELVEKCLRLLPTGGKTPLGDGLSKAGMLLRAQRLRSPDEIQYMVIITDGRANVPIKSDNAFEDALAAAEKIAAEKINVMVLDTEGGYIQFGFAKKLAESMSAQYIKLNDVNKNNVTESVRLFQGSI